MSTSRGLDLIDLYAATTPVVTYSAHRPNQPVLAPKECPFCGEEIVQPMTGRRRWHCTDPVCTTSYWRYYNRLTRVDGERARRLTPREKLAMLADRSSAWRKMLQKV